MSQAYGRYNVQRRPNPRGYGHGGHRVQQHNVGRHINKQVERKAPAVSRRPHQIGNYTLGKTVGQGTFGKVKLGTHNLTGEKVAVKLLDKSKMKEKADQIRVKRELNILKKNHNKNIIQLYEVIDTPTCLYIIMEHCDGGELFDYIVAHQRIPERNACRMFHQILDGLDYLHSVDVTHRDLKPENLLMQSSNDGWLIKIIDFGLSNTHEGGRLLKTACGSPCYAAPEMIAGKKYVGPKADIWSLGVVLFALICGYLPFEDSNTRNLYKKILAGNYQVPHFISSEGRDLIKRILDTNPARRYSIAQIRQHPWCKKSSPKREASDTSVGSQPEYDSLDEDTLAQLQGMGIERDAVVDGISARAHNNETASYYLLLNKNRRASATGTVEPIDRRHLTMGKKRYKPSKEERREQERNHHRKENSNNGVTAQQKARSPQKQRPEERPKERPRTQGSQRQPAPPARHADAKTKHEDWERMMGLRDGAATPAGTTTTTTTTKQPAAKQKGDAEQPTQSSHAKNPQGQTVAVSVWQQSAGPPCTLPINPLNPTPGGASGGGGGGTIANGLSTTAGAAAPQPYARGRVIMARPRTGNAPTTRSGSGGATSTAAERSQFRPAPPTSSRAVSSSRQQGRPGSFAMAVATGSTVVDSHGKQLSPTRKHTNSNRPPSGGVVGTRQNTGNRPPRGTVVNGATRASPRHSTGDHFSRRGGSPAPTGSVAVAASAVAAAALTDKRRPATSEGCARPRKGGASGEDRTTRAGMTQLMAISKPSGTRAVSRGAGIIPLPSATGGSSSGAKKNKNTVDLQEKDSAKSPQKLGAELQRVLNEHGIAYTQHENERFACRKLGVHFHLEITNAGAAGKHKVRGKKVLGDDTEYNQLCGDILRQLKI